MAEQFANDAASVLSANLSSSATTLNVVSATGFPSSGNFRIRIDDEIMTVTAVSGTTFTVSRASEAVSGSQIAASHMAGASVEHVLTAASVQLASSGGSGITIGATVTGGNGDGSILFDTGELAEDSLGNFIYDADGSTGPLGAPCSLYVGDAYTGSYDGVLCLFDAADGEYLALSATSGVWNFGGPGQAPGDETGALYCGNVHSTNTVFATALVASTLTLSASITLSGQTNHASSSTGTLNNAPTAGNPAFWLAVIINGTTYYIPCWS